jgi:hypothetical protein
VMRQRVPGGGLLGGEVAAVDEEVLHVLPHASLKPSRVSPLSSTSTLVVVLVGEAQLIAERRRLAWTEI